MRVCPLVLNSALPLLLIACGTPTPSATPLASVAVVTTPAPIASGPVDFKAFGIPSLTTFTFGGTTVPIESDGPLAPLIRAAGGDPANAEAANVMALAMSGGRGQMPFLALRAPGVSVTSFVDAAQAPLTTLGATERSSRTIGSWTVVTFATPSGAAAAHAFSYTGQGDVIFSFADWSAGDLDALFSAWVWPQ